MTDRDDIQRARRKVVEDGLSERQFAALFPPQFVRKYGPGFRNQGLFGVRASPKEKRKLGRIRFRRMVGRQQPAPERRAERPRTKRFLVRGHYYVYDYGTHRIRGRWKARS